MLVSQAYIAKSLIPSQKACPSQKPLSQRIWQLGCPGIDHRKPSSGRRDRACGIKLVANCPASDAQRSILKVLRGFRSSCSTKVAVVESTHHGFSDDPAALGRFDFSRCRRVMVESLMGTRGMVVVEVVAEDALQVCLVKNDHMIETFAADRGKNKLRRDTYGAKIRHNMGHSTPMWLPCNFPRELT